MDEPFSAVDPVVREELQDEILRLQSELHKTIVFVTHDIDEAIKLGDAVAVFGPGGTLQQYDAPSRLLSNPANDFVAGVHRRRPRLPRPAVLHGRRPSAAPTFGRSPRTRSTGSYSRPGEWRLVVHDDGSPFGWIDADGVELHRRRKSLYDSTTAGGSLFRPDGTLRLALDCGAVLAGGHRCGRRRRRHGDRRRRRPTT